MSGFAKKFNRNQRRAAVMECLKCRPEAVDAVMNNSISTEQMEMKIRQGIEKGVESMKLVFAEKQAGIEIQSAARTMALLFFALHEKFGWGSVRLNRLFDAYKKLSASILDFNESEYSGKEKIDINMIMEALDDETGFNPGVANSHLCMLAGAPSFFLRTDGKLQTVNANITEIAKGDKPVNASNNQ